MEDREMVEELRQHQATPASGDSSAERAILSAVS
jgi:hypothetical protein